MHLKKMNNDSPTTERKKLTSSRLQNNHQRLQQDTQ